MKEVKDEIDLMEKCSRFGHCHAPSCPLDPYFQDRVIYPDDAECQAPLKTRRQIARGYDLPTKGLTFQEVIRFKNGSRVIKKYLSKIEIAFWSGNAIEKKSVAGTIKGFRIKLRPSG